MFSGIVTNLGKITFFDKSKKVIGINSNLKNVKLGDSISCNGICLTISKKENKTLFFNLSKETISKTNLSKSRINDIINLEKSLKSGDEISGHLVFGHVDGISKVIKINNLKDSREIVFKTSSKISKFLIEKCSICLNGVSLTVNYVEKNNFKISIIPYTWNNTTFKNLKIGSILNTEVDMLARYVFKALNK
ncbi:MAG: riboflavin synthase [Rickettsiales bacterium]|nr:riboflavin synthase [Rickettsiales bacterium]